MKMRVMYYSKNAQLKTYADAIGQAFSCYPSEIPPAYPCEKERLVLICATLNGKCDDTLLRFCSQLTPERANHVALLIDGKPGSKAEKEIIETLTSAGTDVLDENFYVKCGIFGKNIPIIKRQEVVDWVRKVQEKAANS